MLNVTLTCTDCGREELFTGEDLTGFLRVMKLAGWYDAPDAEPHSQRALCPACYLERQQRERGGEGGR